MRQETTLMRRHATIRLTSSSLLAVRTTTSTPHFHMDVTRTMAKLIRVAMAMQFTQKALQSYFLPVGFVEPTHQTFSTIGRWTWGPWCDDCISTKTPVRMALVIFLVRDSYHRPVDPQVGPQKWCLAPVGVRYTRWRSSG